MVRNKRNKRCTEGVHYLVNNHFIDTITVEIAELQERKNAKSIKQLKYIQQTVAGLIDAKIACGNVELETDKLLNSDIFIIRVLQLVGTGQNNDKEKVYSFLSENLDELSEALLLSIPKVIKIFIEKAPKERNNIAAILNRFGNWIQEFSLGQYDMNIELAIAAYKQALHIRTRDSHPLAWAQSMSNLSIALCVRIRGERSQNIEKAISTVNLSRS